METILRAEGLCKTFSSCGRQQHVLKNLDLELYRGDFTVIMGASGSGKSTLLYALSGMDRPTLGRVEHDGTDITRLSEDELALFRRRHTGFVFQQIYLIDTMSVLDNVLASGYLVSKDRKAVREKARRLLEACGLSKEITAKFPAQVSGGEAQRAGIVRALVNDPDLVYADEPTGALNSQTASDILDVFSEVNAAGQSVVMVTHDIKTARRGSRVLYLADGAIVGDIRLGAYRHGDSERHGKLKAFLAEMGW